MKKLKVLGLLAVVAAVLMGIMASNAFAVEKPEGLTETITEGAGTVAGEGILTLTFGGSSLKCGHTLTATVAESGHVEITKDAIDNTEASCATTVPKLPWEGKVCEISGTPNTIWLFFNTSISSPFGSFTGWVKTQLDGSFSGTVFTSTKQTTLSKSQIGTSAASLDGTITLSKALKGTTANPEVRC